MPDYSDLGKDKENASNIENVDKTDSDYGDGDGVNEFDETYNEMKKDSSEFQYEEGDPNDAVGSSDDIDEKKTEMSSEERAEGIDTGIEDEEPAETKAEHIQCRNENLDGKEHPETGVPFERKQIEVDGKQYEVVVPQFESKYDAQLPEDKLKSTDREQFVECNAQLKEEVVRNKELRDQFDDEQIEQIENGDTPDGYTWHHDADVGKMQLVDTEIHQKTGHTGGRSIWGGGTDNR